MKNSPDKLYLIEHSIPNSKIFGKNSSLDVNFNECEKIILTEINNFLQDKTFFYCKPSFDTIKTINSDFKLESYVNIYT